MKLKRMSLVVILSFVVVLAVFGGCAALTPSQTSAVDIHSAKIVALEQTTQAKIEAAKSGSLTTGQALDFVQYAGAQIKQANAQINALRADSQTPWVNVVGSVILSVIGSLSGVKLWRGGINNRKGVGPV